MPSDIILLRITHLNEDFILSDMQKYLNFLIKVGLANIRKLNHPYKIFLVITKSCGSRCTNCLIWKETPVNELTLPEYEMLAKNLGKNLSWLNISGGEPTDREDLIDIIKIFEKNCPNLLIINFTSNGLNTSRLISVANYLETSIIPIVGINVSIDGPEEVHLRLRGGVDSYQMAITSFRAIRKLKKIKTFASMTLFEKNSHLVDENFLQIKKYIPDIKKSEIHLRFSFQSEHYYQNGTNSSVVKTILPVSLRIKKSIYRLSLVKIIQNIYLNKLINFIETNKNPMPCSSMTSNIYISEHGELFPCSIWNKNLGSLREASFNLMDLLKSKNAQEIKNQISENNCPNCWSPGEAFPSIIDNLPKIFSK